MGISARGRSFKALVSELLVEYPILVCQILFLSVSPVVHKILSTYVWNSTIGCILEVIPTASCDDGTGATRSPLPHWRPIIKCSGILGDSLYLLCKQGNEHAEQIDTSHTCIVRTDNDRSWNVYLLVGGLGPMLTHFNWAYRIDWWLHRDILFVQPSYCE